MIPAVFSSNFIERAGLDLDQTTEICRRIFKGESIVAEEIDQKFGKAAKEYTVERNGPERETKRHIIQSRAEIIQHLHMVEHMFRVMLIDNQPLSESLILSTHRILTQGINNYHRDGQLHALQRLRRSVPYHSRWSQ